MSVVTLTRHAGADLSDYFNFGSISCFITVLLPMHSTRFDEATWTEYCVKQNAMRREVAALKTQKAIQAMQAGTYPSQSLLQGAYS